MTMKIEFHDANVFLGLPTRAIHGPVATAAELVAVMDRNDIAMAVAWHVAQRDSSPVVGNELLAREIRGCERLLGAGRLSAVTTQIRA